MDCHDLVWAKLVVNKVLSHGRLVFVQLGKVLHNPLRLLIDCHIEYVKALIKQQLVHLAR